MSDGAKLPDAELRTLVEAYCIGSLSEEEWARLERRLLSDADARAHFRRYLALDAALRDHGEMMARHWMDTESHESRRPSKVRIRIASGLAAVAAVALIAFVFLHGMRAGADAGASLEQVAGDVRILAADGQVRAITAGAPIRSGDTVRTRGRQSSTVVAYPDGTRLTLVGDTSVTCGDIHSMSLVVHQGTLTASVRPQPRETPMRLATPTAQVQVLGTRFSIDAAANRTDLRVTQGMVRLVRVSDGSTVQVSHGKQAAVTEQDQLLVEDIPRLSPTWEVDFEDGLPAGWIFGEHVTQGLPQGSRGAVRAARDEGDDGVTYFGVGSQSAWSPGLFAVGKDSHLHVTFKMEKPSWLNVFLVTRTSEPQELQFAGNFIFKEFPKIEPGNWLTVSIPLSRFRQLPPGTEPIEQLTPFHVILNSTAPDRGLVIDRMWVTPDGPGEVTIREIE